MTVDEMTRCQNNNILYKKGCLTSVFHKSNEIRSKCIKTFFFVTIDGEVWSHLAHLKGALQEKAPVLLANRRPDLKILSMGKHSSLFVGKEKQFPA